MGKIRDGDFDHVSVDFQLKQEGARRADRLQCCRANDPLHGDESAVVLMTRRCLVVHKFRRGKRTTRDFANLGGHDLRRVSGGGLSPQFDTGAGNNRKAEGRIYVDRSGGVLKKEDLLIRIIKCNHAAEVHGTSLGCLLIA